MVEFAEGRLGENQDPDREPYSVLGNNCSHFCQNTLAAAGIRTPWQIDPRPASYIQELQEDTDFKISYDPETDELTADQRMFNVNRHEILEWKALPLWKRLFVDPPGEDQSSREPPP